MARWGGCGAGPGPFWTPIATRAAQAPSGNPADWRFQALQTQPARRRPEPHRPAAAILARSSNSQVVKHAFLPPSLTALLRREQPIQIRWRSYRFRPDAEYPKLIHCNDKTTYPQLFCHNSPPSRPPVSRKNCREGRLRTRYTWQDVPPPLEVFTHDTKGVLSASVHEPF